MPISLSCNSCQRALRVKDELAGKQILCPDCQTKLTVPAGDFAVPPPLPAAEETPYGGFTDQAPASDPMSARAELPPKPDLGNDFEDDAPRPPRKPPKPAKEFGGINAGVGGGILMMVLAVVWFVLCLFMDRIAIYPPILFVLGLIAFIRGLINRES
jgi:hypothetical protein